MKKGDKAYVISGLVVKSGEFVSESKFSKHIQFEDGVIIGYNHTSVFSKKTKALEKLVTQLKTKLTAIDFESKVENLFSQLNNSIEKIKQKVDK